MANQRRFERFGVRGMEILFLERPYVYNMSLGMRLIRCEELRRVRLRNFTMFPLSVRSRKLLIFDGRLFIELVNQLVSIKGKCTVTNPVRLRWCILCQRHILPKIQMTCSGPVIHHGAPCKVSCIKFSQADCNLAFTVSNQNTSIWDMSSEHEAKRLALVRMHKGDITGIASHPFDSSIFVTGSEDKTAKLWRSEKSPDGLNVTCVATCIGHKQSVNSVAFDPTGRFVATGSDDKTAKLWRSEESLDGLTVTCVDTLKGHSERVRSVAFDPTGRFLATGSGDRTAKVWRMLPDGSIDDCLVTLGGHTGPVVSVAFDPTGRFLATGSGDVTGSGVGAWYLWRLPTDDNPKVTWVATLREDNGLVLTIAFHPQLPLIATGSFKIAKIWRISNSSRVSCVATMNNLNGFVSSVDWKPDGSSLAIASWDGASVWR